MLKIEKNTNVFAHTDYRTFLKSYHEAQKSRQNNWTLGRWAQQLGLSSTAVLTNILNGKRNPGGHIAGQLVKYFAFDDKEREYFLDLIALHKVMDKPRLTQFLIDKLGESHPQGRFILLDDQRFSVIARPLYYALRELVQTKDFREDSQWIKKRLALEVTPTQIERAISDLISVGLLARDAQQQLIYAQGSVTTTHDTKNEALRRFHEEMLDLAQKSIRDTDVLDRDITGMTISVESSQLPEIKDFLKKVRRQFAKKFEAKSQLGDQVLHLEMALFPLSNKNKKMEVRSE